MAWVARRSLGSSTAVMQGMRLGNEEAVVREGRPIMVHALLLIAFFHAVLWVALGVLTMVEPAHPEAPAQATRRPQDRAVAVEPGAAQLDGSLGPVA